MDEIPGVDGLRGFVVAGRLVQMPARQSKRVLVLDWLAQGFELGRHYTEAEVNELLDGHHLDVATLRRSLVDAGFLDRAGGEYWRAGGST
jgi:hypothetical protein